MHFDLIPKNGHHYKRLMHFFKEFISILPQSVNPVVYGSLVHFYHTRDTSMTVNDVDIMVQEEQYPQLIAALKNHSQFSLEMNLENGELFVRNAEGDLLIEVDYQNTETSFNPIPMKWRVDGDEIGVFAFSESDMEKMYSLARFYNQRGINSDVEKIEDRIAAFERFLGRDIAVWKSEQRC